jgi:tRNA nucleotidyltransferase/poly(A) polymerase
MDKQSPDQVALQSIGKLVKGSEYEGKTFLAGGAVRDEIMGQPLKDIDKAHVAHRAAIKFLQQGS